MRLDRTAALISFVGLATSAHAQAADKQLNLVPTRAAGTLYINLQTGERTLTRYNQDPKHAIPTFVAHSLRDTTSLFDYWTSIDGSPCTKDSAVSQLGHFAIELDTPSDLTADVPISNPVVAFDFGDLPFDSKVSGLILTTSMLAAETTDADNDGQPDTGIDLHAVFYDALSEGNRTSIAAPTAAVRIGPLPGNDGSVPSDADPGAIPRIDVILDFAGQHFELGDSDGHNRGDLWLPGANPGADYSAIITVTECTTTEFGGNGTDCSTLTIPNPSPDRLADFQYLQYYTQHNTDDKVTDVSTFIAIGAPDGEVYTTLMTFTTVVDTICTESGITVSCPTVTSPTSYYASFLVPGPFPQAQSTIEGFGYGALGAGIDSIDWTLGGCCFWYGGLECVGFLDQLQAQPAYNESWYNYTPYAQISIGLLSDAPPEDCSVIDYAADGVLDNADISAFVASFLFDFDIIYDSFFNPVPDPPKSTADLNADGVIDNGDIIEFVNRFLTCTN